MRLFLNLTLTYLFVFDRSWLNELSEWDRLMYYTYRWQVLAYFLSVYAIQIIIRACKKYKVFELGEGHQL